MPSLTGTDGPDTLRGSSADDVIYGGGGNDQIYGGAGTNDLFGEAGDDRFVWDRSGLGVDRINGGSGFDTVDFGTWNPAAFFFTTPLSFSVGSSGQIRGVASFWERGRGYNDVEIASITDIERLITNIYASVQLGDYQRDIEVIGSAVTDTISTGSGNDRIQGGGGNDTINGGPGYDTALYTGFRGAYGQVTQVRVSGGPEGGVDNLINIEALQFLDGRLVFSTTAPSGMWEEDGATVAISRLYDTVLDRLPDWQGLLHYRTAVDDGYDLRHFAQAMIESPEFVARYGALDNEALVRQLYRAVLNRDADPTGLAEYTQALDRGLLRSDLVLILSESPEHRLLYEPVWQTQVRTSQNENFDSGSLSQDEKYFYQPDFLHFDIHIDAGVSDWLL